MNLFGLVLFNGDAAMHGHSHETDKKHSHSADNENPEAGTAAEAAAVSAKTQAEQLNMKGIFLHVAGDAAGSVVVVLSALLMYFYNNCEADGNEVTKCAVNKQAFECGDYLKELTTTTKKYVGVENLTRFLRNDSSTFNIHVFQKKNHQNFKMSNKIRLI